MVLVLSGRRLLQHFQCGDPLLSLAIDPFALSLGAIFLADPYANAMLFPVLPTAYVFIPIGPFESTLSVFLPVFEVAFIFATVVPNLTASALHVAHPELALVHLVQIREVVLAEALELAVHEITLVITPIVPFKPALPVFLPLVELSRVLRGITVPHLRALSVLHVFMPFTLVSRVVRIDKDTISICFVIFPVAFVKIPIGMRHSALAVGFVPSPHALVFRPIRPKLYAYSVSLPGLLVPLPFVQSAIPNILELINVHPFNALIAL